MKRFSIIILAIVTLAFASCKKEYTVTVLSNNNAYGTVTGGGTYKEGSTATIAAIPADNCRFVEWQDNNTNNPRTFEVTGDMSFIANFEQESTYADAFVGEYTVTTHATFNNVPMVGTYSTDLPEMDAKIEKLEGDNVQVTMSDQVTTGYVNSSGLHIEPIVINHSISGYNVSITIIFPTISAPVNGTTSWTSNLNTTISGMAITGTADMTAVMK